MHRVIGVSDLDDVEVDTEEARALYRDMVRARRFDERAVALQRRGWMSSFPPYRGQEASQVGAARAMADEDWLFPTYRSNAMQLTRGVPMSDILLFRRGRPEYYSDHDVNNFPQEITIGTQIPHAVGYAMARDYVGADHATLAYFGDGATSEGDFHEGLNFAGVFDAPVVFFCENNDWAISLPRERQTASATIAEKATAYGFEGVQVDGNDPLAVYETVSDALATARAGKPILVESLTYRQGAHTTADDPERYRDEHERSLPDWRTADPLERTETYLREQDVVDDTVVEQAHAAADAELDEAVAEAENAEVPDPDELFENAYGDLTAPLEAQREWLRSYLDDHDPQRVEF
ncbi:Pyruvate/2-oxoglutarate/acetoin dehydrogenase complex, dehydrogenase (E1) component, eukaryotic type, alpha subunit [Halanaeroarchaeum sp. HSR-CO]|uniref:pyruvate dehydrogenase (acetyl-transferring) E1 component subunit alpha n=1 Tax=Halanaeroarchaeum sp. HSR-CO TaxID=2866382 RepID=UPI00217D0983|nr:pyruvate dehydrogenase (acetyl-transferring) E1 component subunit alpha [Halanaeroarchaeum sp. HSR-CO]UWG48836.1 Pyruvate/2-oxoglutarate/acetoin dehydrogenase complex, dehydrogenase (E1) component, eukaryotic type, alpha subunit [Halanaeroarchaeum sp. HSR-CO]